MHKEIRSLQFIVIIMCYVGIFLGEFGDSYLSSPNVRIESAYLRTIGTVRSSRIERVTSRLESRDTDHWHYATEKYRLQLGRIYVWVNEFRMRFLTLKSSFSLGIYTLLAFYLTWLDRTPDWSVHIIN